MALSNSNPKRRQMTQPFPLQP
ncbi:hypothetical protein CCACVL1_22941 [Corchorus capsularis]|uniref:Uncharacterized protein n=1 Tax=Corchorus capsularis TaxID=210143 RepID=A0A1R3GVY0_COCAP|nr:hypothetical protein CCACVL1_22941 [Corchorus capsularis]